MKIDLEEQFRGLRQKYSVHIENKEKWESKSVSEFFHAYRPLISSLLKDYPKFSFKGVDILAGLPENDMPFEKELIQAKILQSILQEYVILLPRYANEIFHKIFGIELENGSIGDGIVFLPERDQYIEFKICHNSKIGSYINKVDGNDLIFIVVDDVDIYDKSIYRNSLQKRSERWDGWEKSEIVICDMQGIGFWRLKKETQQDLPLNSPTATVELPSRGHRTDELTPPTVPLVYLNELKSVNKDLTIHYPSYFFKQIESFKVKKPEYLFLFGGSLNNSDSLLEYRIVRNRLAKEKIRTISPKDVIGKEENRLWLGMATAVVEFKSATGTKLCPISAEEFARELGVRRIRIEDLIPGFTLIKEKNSIKKKTDSESISRQKTNKRRR